MAGPAPGAAQRGRQPPAGCVGERTAGGLLEGVRRQVAPARRCLDRAALPQRADLGGAQGAGPDVELVEGAREDGVRGVVRAAQPVVGERAEGRRGRVMAVFRATAVPST